VAVGGDARRVWAVKTSIRDRRVGQGASCGVESDGVEGGRRVVGQLDTCVGVFVVRVQMGQSCLPRECGGGGEQQGRMSVAHEGMIARDTGFV